MSSLENALVARNIRRYRVEKGLSLGELARRSGVSKQTLSKVEQGAGNPTVETMSALGVSLGVSMRQLMTEWGTPVFVQRGTDAPWTDHATWSERVLDEVFGSGRVRTYLMRLERGAQVTATEAPLPPGSLQHVFVIRGRLRTGPTTDPVEVAAGDFVRFPGDSEHRHVCLSDAVLAHVVSTIPQLRQFGASTTSREASQ